MSVKLSVHTLSYEQGLPAPLDAVAWLLVALSAQRCAATVKVLDVVNGHCETHCYCCCLFVQSGVNKQVMPPADVFTSIRQKPYQKQNPACQCERPFAQPHCLPAAPRKSHRLPPLYGVPVSSDVGPFQCLTCGQTAAALLLHFVHRCVPLNACSVLDNCFNSLQTVCYAYPSAESVCAC